MAKLKFSLSTIAAALTAVSTAVDTTKILLGYTGAVMAAVEDAYNGKRNAGAAKKLAVLVAVEALARQLGAEWVSFKATVSEWIDNVKAVYNAVSKTEDKAQPA